MKRRFPLFFAAEADTTAGAPPDPPAEPHDWAEQVTKSLQPEQQKTVAPPETKVDTKVETKKADPIPAELFPKKEEKQEPKPAESEIDKIETPEFRGESTRKGWDALKGKAKELESKYHDTEKRVADLTKQLEAAAEGSKRAEELQAKLSKAEQQAEEYRGLVQKVNIDLDPEFRKQYVDGRANLIKDGKRIAEDSGVEPSTIEAALNLRGKARSDALREAADSFSPFDVSRLGAIIQQLDRLDSEAEARRGNPDEYFKEREAQSRAQYEAQQKKIIEETTKAYQRAEQELGDKLLILRKLDGEQFKDWNARADELRQKAKAFWETNNDPKRAAEVTIKGFAAEVYESAYSEMKGDRDAEKARADKAEAELAKIYGNGPKLGSSTTATKEVKADDWAEQVVSQFPGRQ